MSSFKAKKHVIAHFAPVFATSFHIIVTKHKNICFIRDVQAYVMDVQMNVSKLRFALDCVQNCFFLLGDISVLY